MQSIKDQSNTSPINNYEKEEILQKDKKHVMQFKKNKVCAECKNWIIRQKSTSCTICEDAYHLSCIRPKLVKRPQKWTCTHCIALKDNFPDTNELEQQTHCGRCSKYIPIEDEEFCSKCSKPFHKNCYSPKKVAPICVFCEQQKPRIIQQNQLLLKFLPQRVSFKNQNCFILPCCVYDEKLREKCFNSIQYALYCQNIQFNDNLVYRKVQKKENTVTLEPQLQQLTGKDLEAFLKYKQVTQYGLYGPLLVDYSLDQGFYVKAVQPIARKTLICEYVGEVFKFAEQVYSTSDSMMSLLETQLSATSLVIIPEKFGNIAKYLSGINNFKKNSKKVQQNVISQRFNVQGEARVILYTCRDIKPGEILYYDYNEGGLNYNTKHFV